MKFRASGLYISVLPPALIGALVGFLSAIMGVGGGFILVPAMIYLLKGGHAGCGGHIAVSDHLHNQLLRRSCTRSTARRSICCLLLIIGGVIGAQVGARVSQGLKAEQLRILLALLVLAVCVKIGCRPCGPCSPGPPGRRAGRTWK